MAPVVAAIRGDTTHPAGAKLTRKLVLTELPFGNRTVKLRLTGAAIRQVLEHGVSRSGRGAGRFPQASGLAFAFDPRKPAGARVTRVTVGGNPRGLAHCGVLVHNSDSDSTGKE